jgi:RNA polymerase sigma-70 factor (ECF subfamily)
MTTPDVRAEERLTAFAAHRPLLFSIAYRMLGSSSDAEDVVQDAYLRWQRAGADDVRSAKDYLSATGHASFRSTTCARRVCAARYTWGRGFPNRWSAWTSTIHSPRRRSPSLSRLRSLVLLERLTPTQRAAFLLREVFAFDYADVARILDTTEGQRATARAARQAAHRVGATTLFRGSQSRFRSIGAIPQSEQ